MATGAKPAVARPSATPPPRKDSGKAAASTGSNSSKTTTGSAIGSANSKDAVSGKKPSLKPGDSAAAPGPSVLLWPDGKPTLGSDGKPIDPSTLTVVVEKDGKSVVHGPDGKPILLPDGRPLDPALVPPKEEAPPPTQPDPFLHAPPPRFSRPPWEKPSWQGLGPPRFLPYSAMLLEAANLKLPPQVEFEDALWERSTINLKRSYPKLVKLHLGPVGVMFEKHAGPCQCFLQILERDIPDFPELVGKPQFSTCNLFIR